VEGRDGPSDDYQEGARPAGAPEDDHRLGCAAAGRVEYLVTGEEELLAVGRYRGVTILTAREFLSVLHG
jgi:predicted nucleic acid-binding protein